MENSNEEIAADRVLSVEEGAEIKQRIAAQRSLKRWRWMGNYGDPTQAAAVANVDPPCVAGEVMFSVNGDLVPAWMFY
ncbi:hypothetical protein [Streptomyces agglomeratus]|uniref:hypothetical protein n=1 Tax=Streptomyces agglomeratus TaxID=285458 RepID=UPI00099F8803|nr:hypothetical protein [Streptomyces agglomeratus]